MQKRQSNYVNMIRAALNYCAQHPTIISSIPALAAHVETVSNKLILVDGLNQVAHPKTSGVTTDTNLIRFAMQNLALKCGSALSAYAATIQNNTLRFKVNFTERTLNKLKKEEVDDHCQTIHDEALAHLAAASGFGYTPTDVTDLQTAINIYRQSMTNPRQAIITRSQAIANIKATNRTIIDYHFKEIIDHIVNTLRTTHPQFVSGYFQSRIIINLGTTHAKVRGTIKNQEEIPLVEATFTIINTETKQTVVEVKTTTGGKFNSGKLNSGTYDFIFTHPQYLTHSETNIRISAGKELRRKITLKPINIQ
jgi:hypothetical protein